MLKLHAVPVGGPPFTNFTEDMKFMMHWCHTCHTMELISRNSLFNPILNVFLLKVLQMLGRLHVEAPNWKKND